MAKETSEKILTIQNNRTGVKEYVTEAEWAQMNEKKGKDRMYSQAYGFTLIPDAKVPKEVLEAEAKKAEDSAKK